MLVIVSLAVVVLLLGAYLRLSARFRSVSVDLAQKARECELHRSTVEQLQLRDSLKDEFISTVSHELRTPLTSIRGALGLLSSGVLGRVDDRAANLLRIASNNTDRLVRLLNDILDLQKIESGAAPLPMLPCPLGELLRGAVETMSPMADAASVQVAISPLGELEQLTVHGHPDRLAQVLCNLLSNAIKFSPHFTTICVQASVESDMLAISVADNGRGVPADKLETIFERFGQVEASDARQKGGTGLGLAICRSIITQHGGTIHAKRNDATVPGQPGATLVIRLPLSAPKTESPSAMQQLLA